MKIAFAVGICATLLSMMSCSGKGNDVAKAEVTSAPKETTPAAAPVPRAEIRGVWITNVDSDVLTSHQKIADAMDALHAAHINVVYPVVWNKAMTMYPSDQAASVTGIQIDPIYAGRDPLQEVIIEAHRNGIEVVPWFEYGFAASYNGAGGLLVEKKPGWKALDQSGALATKSNFEWLNSMDPEVREFMAGMILEVAKKYDVDGIQGDDRLPSLPSIAGYDEKTKALYRAKFGQDPPADPKDKQWVKFRADILTDWLAELRQRVKAVDPSLTISMAPSYYPWALQEYLQDSKAWVDLGLVDTIHPQAYRKTLPEYQKIIDELTTTQFSKSQLPMVAPGLLVKVGPYVITKDYLLGAIAYNRAHGINGEVFFFYEGLRANNDELLNALKNGPYAEPAALPYRAVPRRPDGVTFGGFEALPRVDKSMLPDTFRADLDGHVSEAAVYDVFIRFDAPSKGAKFSLAEDSGKPLKNSGDVVLKGKGIVPGEWISVGNCAVSPDGKQHVLLYTPEGVMRGAVDLPMPTVMLLINRKMLPAMTK
ncbi:hypothetical protein BH09SUM1_BH09SUM1_13780 [soil metagenome]